MISFMKYKWLYFLISGIAVLVSIFSLSLWGLRPSIDFVGGSLLEIKFPEDIYSQTSIDKLKDEVSKVSDVNISSIQPQNDTTSFVIRTNQIDENKKNEVVSKLKETIGESSVSKFETVGPTLGRELLIKTVIAIILASIFIMFYVARQFKDRVYGVSAILAMIHDTLILIGTFSLLGKFFNVEVDTLFVTAVLTTLSFSVHDTIVVFDRIRERSAVRVGQDFNQIANSAVMQTLVRSLNNSILIIFMLVALVVLGGSTVRWFALALLIGTICGTYSSPFVAVPILSILQKRKTRKG